MANETVETVDYRPFAEQWVKARDEYEAAVTAAVTASRLADEARRIAYDTLCDVEKRFTGSVTRTERTAIFLVNEGKEAVVATYNGYSETPSFELVKVTT